MEEQPAERPPYVFIGVRSCDIHAIAVQDRTFMEGAWADPTTRQAAGGSVHRRRQLRQGGRHLLLRLDGDGAPCAPSASTWRSPRSSMGRSRLPRGGRERARAPRCWPSPSRGPQPDERRRRAWWSRPPTDGPEHRHLDIRDLLYSNLRALRAGTRWPTRCLTCANCTMVCPTCFCTSVDDVTDLTGEEATAASAAGTPASPSILLHPRRQHPELGQVALPAVDDPQAGQLDRPVRHLGLRRLRPLHHLVPGGIDITEEAAAIRATDLGAPACARLTPS